MAEIPAFVCDCVASHSKPVLLVARDVDGDWIFVCGAGHAPNHQYRVVGIEHLFLADASLVQVQDLGSGWQCERTATDAAWNRTLIDREEFGE